MLRINLGILKGSHRGWFLEVISSFPAEHQQDELGTALLQGPSKLGNPCFHIFLICFARPIYHLEKTVSRYGLGIAHLSAARLLSFCHHFELSPRAVMDSF